MTDLRTAAQRLLGAVCAALPYAPLRAEFDVVADTADALRAALAEPVQEPVAWLTPRTVDSYSRPDLGYETSSKTDYGAFPVYTAPPPRKPLTQEEIPALAEKAWTPSVYCDAEALLGTDGLVALVRAVEAKHNIKE